MSNQVLAQIIAVFGENYSYKQAMRFIKLAGGRVLKVVTSSGVYDASTVTFSFPDNTTLDIRN